MWIHKENPQLWKELVEQLLARKSESVSIAHILYNLKGFEYSNIFTKNNNYYESFFNEMQTFYENQYGNNRNSCDEN